jgi:hypothetical protein
MIHWCIQWKSGLNVNYGGTAKTMGAAKRVARKAFVKKHAAMGAIIYIDDDSNMVHAEYMELGKWIKLDSADIKL